VWNNLNDEGKSQKGTEIFSRKGRWRLKGRKRVESSPCFFSGGGTSLISRRGGKKRGGINCPVPFIEEGKGGCHLCDLIIGREGHWVRIKKSALLILLKSRPQIIWGEGKECGLNLRRRKRIRVNPLYFSGFIKEGGEALRLYEEGEEVVGVESVESEREEKKKKVPKHLNQENRVGGGNKAVAFFPLLLRKEKRGGNYSLIRMARRGRE